MKTDKKAWVVGGGQLTRTTSVDELDVCVRTYNGLKNSDVKTVGDMLSLSPSHFLTIHNFGKASLDEVKAILAPFGWPDEAVIKDARKATRLNEAVADAIRQSASTIATGLLETASALLIDDIYMHLRLEGERGQRDIKIEATIDIGDESTLDAVSLNDLLLHRGFHEGLDSPEEARYVINKLQFLNKTILL